METESLEELNEILKELHNLTGFRISLHDTSFNEIKAYPPEVSEFCALIQSFEEGKTRCVENDRCAFRQVTEVPEVYLYQCCFGLYEAVAPLYVLGNIMGYLMMGQIIDRMTSSRDILFQNAVGIIKDKTKLQAAVEKVRIEDKQKILSSIKIFDICAQYITLSNRFHLNREELPDRVKKYIDTHFKENITIEFLTRHFFSSRSTLSKGFKKKYKLGIIEYLTKVRIDNAIKLLRETAFTVQDISESCGYTDQNYFSKAFKKMTGDSPTKFRSTALK